MNWYTIGSFTFPASWAAIVISFLLTGIILRLLFKKQNIVDLYGNAVFIFIIIWKLSIVIFDFKTTISNPMTIVYFHGGLKGYWLGIMTVCIYLIYICYKKHCFYQEKAIMVFAWMMTVSIYELGIGLLNGYAFWLVGFQIIVNAAMLIWLKQKLQDFQWLVQLLILFTMFQVFFYSMRHELLTVPVLTFIVVAAALLCYLFDRRENNG